MRLLTLNHAELQKLFDGMEKDCDMIRKNALQLTWYMRGGVSYEDVLNMSQRERKMIEEIAEANFKVTKETQMPFF